MYGIQELSQKTQPVQNAGRKSTPVQNAAKPELKPSQRQGIMK